MQNRAPTSVAATLIAGLAAAVPPAVVGVAFLGRYGWDRDELYFLAASRHLAFGYVDFPPLVAVFGRVVVGVFGPSLDALRLSTMVVGLTSVVFVALCTRELGGRLRAQFGAALAWSTAPFVLGAASIFHPTWLDLAAQTCVLYLVLVAVLRPLPRLWPIVGVVAGVGLEAKYTIATLLFALVVGVGLSPGRALIRTRGPWIAATIALLLLVPNIAWEVAHGWPSVSFASSQRVKTASDTPPLTYIAEILAFLAASAVLAGIGSVWLWRRCPLRPFAWAAGLVVFGFGVEQGRAYYPLPALIVCVAAGAVALEQWHPRRHWRRWVTLGTIIVIQLGVIAIAAPLVVPIRSTTGMIRAGIADQTFYQDEIGWPGLVAQNCARMAHPSARSAPPRRHPRRQLRRSRRARLLGTTRRPPSTIFRPPKLAILAPTAPSTNPRAHHRLQHPVTARNLHAHRADHPHPHPIQLGQRRTRAADHTVPPFPATRPAMAFQNRK